MDKSELDIKFEKCVGMIRNGPEKKTTDDVKLQFYSLYKQATEGNCHLKQPWAIQVIARAKWDAWKALEGMIADDAKRKYIELFESEEAQIESKINK